MSEDQIKQFKDKLHRIGLSMKNVEDHLRSNSVDCIGNQDKKEILQIFKQLMTLGYKNDEII